MSDCQHAASNNPRHSASDGRPLCVKCGAAFRSGEPEVVAWVPAPEQATIYTPARDENVLTVYVAGPMSNIPDFNFPAFIDAATALRKRGHTVVSPVELDEADGFDEKSAGEVAAGSQQWGEFLARDLAVIARADVDAVVVLPGWEQSNGAAWETRWARQLGKPILTYPDLTPVTAEVRVVNAKTGGAKGRKPQRFELVPMAALGSIAEVYAFGAGKYSDWNWRRGYQWSLSFGAMMRHLAQYWEGEDADAESGLSHLAHAGFHVLTLLTFAAEHPELDDRASQVIGGQDDS